MTITLDDVDQVGLRTVCLQLAVDYKAGDVVLEAKRYESYVLGDNDAS